MDSVDIVMGWEAAFGIPLPDSEVESLRTPRQCIDLIAAKLQAPETSANPCLTLRAFHRLRYAITKVTGMPRHKVRPDSRLRTLMRNEGPDTWMAVSIASCLSDLPKPGLFSMRTVADLMAWTITNAAKDLKRPNEPWTRAEIRHVVRAVVTEVVGTKSFSDDDDFVRDIGMC